ncbi:MAG: ScyD/ScyE family protein [Caldilineaceae bacterium]
MNQNRAGGASRSTRWISAAISLISSLLFAPLLSGVTVQAQAPVVNTPNANVTVVTTGLNNPRGLKFGPDGALYVAEAGLGGATSTVGQCQQAGPEIGPYTGGNTARISKIDQDGVRTTVADNLPSAQDVMSSVIGVADVAFINEQLYALIGGAGCSHGHTDFNNGVYRVNSDGSITLVADISAFMKANPVAEPDAADFEPDGSLYSMIAWKGELYVVEANGGQLLKVTLDGTITRIIDFSKDYGHIVPTVVAVHDAKFWVGNLGEFDPGAPKPAIYRVKPDGQAREFIPNLDRMLGLLYEDGGRLFVLEPLVGGFAPGAGQLLRIRPSGQQTVTIASGLTFPTGLTSGPKGDLYVSNKGFGAAPGEGEVVRVQLSKQAQAMSMADSAADFADPEAAPDIQSQVFLPLVNQ